MSDESPKEMGLVKVESGLVPAVTAPTPDITLTAENVDEMAQAQTSIISWCRAKVAEVRHQANELKEAFEYAVKQKWRNDVLKRHAVVAEKRLSFYEKMLTALEHGYQIVPSFPITAFAVRTDKKRPLKMMTTSHYKKHTQVAEGLPAGEGEYKNPFPEVYQRTMKAATATTAEVCQYFADAWKDLEFPVSMSKPQIMEATTRAMALNIFDDIGILPGFAPNEGTTPPKGDPLIIARLRSPIRTAWGEKTRYVSFIVAWHLNTADL